MRANFVLFAAELRAKRLAGLDAHSSASSAPLIVKARIATAIAPAQILS